MIKVKTLECFDRFVEIAKANGVIYQVIGSRCDKPPNVDVSPTLKFTKVKLTCVLCCSLFNVYLDTSINISNKTSLLEIIKKYNIEEFNEINFKNGTIECE